MKKYRVLTLFPEMIKQVMSQSIIGRALENGIIDISAVNIRDYSTQKHSQVDDYPYGGGAGMVMQAEPICRAVEDVKKGLSGSLRILYMSPKGRTFNQDLARAYSQNDNLIFLCGHYEGVDERALEIIKAESVSIGDYVLTGGELAAMVMIDSISRMVSGVLSNEDSKSCETFDDGLLEYPQYTRPEIYNGMSVPAILLSGDHAKVDAWRRRESIKLTGMYRPDLLKKARLSLQERKDVFGE